MSQNKPLEGSSVRLSPQDAFPGSTGDGKADLWVDSSDSHVKYVTAAGATLDITRPVSTVTNTQTASGALVVYVFDIPNTAGNYDRVLDAKFEVLQVSGFKTSSAGGAGDSVKLVNVGEGDITTAQSLEFYADKGAFGVADIDDAFNTIAAGGTLRVTALKATNCAIRITVAGVLRA